MEQPKSRAFADLSWAIDKAIDATQWERDALPLSRLLQDRGTMLGWHRQAAPTPAPHGAGLLTALQDSLQGRAGEPEMLAPFVPDVAPINEVIRASPAAAWLESRPELPKLRAQLARQVAMRRVAEAKRPRFGAPAASYRLLSVASMVVGLYLSRIESGTRPRQPARADWRKALQGVEALRALQSKGVSLGSAIIGPWGPAPLPFNWIDMLQSAIERALRDAPKPHIDESANEREAVRWFVHSMLIHFDDAPPSMVTTFAALIDYKSGTLTRTHLPAWVKQFRAGSLL